MLYTKKMNSLICFHSETSNIVWLNQIGWYICFFLRIAFATFDANASLCPIDGVCHVNPINSISHSHIFSNVQNINGVQSHWYSMCKYACCYLMDWLNRDDGNHPLTITASYMVHNVKSIYEYVILRLGNGRAKRVSITLMTWHLWGELKYQMDFGNQVVGVKMIICA